MYFYTKWQVKQIIEKRAGMSHSEKDKKRNRYFLQELNTITKKAVYKYL